VKLSNVLKPWVFALIGGLLILGSSYLSGVIILEKDKKISDIYEKIRAIESDYARAERADDIAGLKGDLNALQRVLAMVVFQHDQTLQSKWDEVQIAGLYVEVIQRHTASGRLLDKESIKNLKKLRDDAIAGDEDSYNSLQDMAFILTEEAGRYFGNLILKKAAYEHQLNLLNSDIVYIKELAGLIQLLGLIILLLKELPESFFKKLDERQKKVAAT